MMASRELTEYDRLMMSLGLSPSTPIPERKKVAECGTYSGVSRHRRLGEDVCRQCREARNAYDRARRAERGLKPRGGRRRPPGSPQVGGVPAAAREHGTVRGARQHWKYKESVCASCRDAYNTWQAIRRLERKGDFQKAA